MNIVKRLVLLAVAIVGLAACSSDPDIQTNGLQDSTLKQEAVDRIVGQGIDQLTNQMKFTDAKKGVVYLSKSATFNVGYGECSLTVWRTEQGNVGLLVPYSKDSNLPWVDLDAESDDMERELWNVVWFTSRADLETREELKGYVVSKNCKFNPASTTASTQPTN
ncbi:MAG TPA: hypothetical protein VFZ48_05010 [Candidatus Saccharimonadales bacterium]